MKIEWKRKLSSRKLWMAFGLFVSGVLSFWISPEVVAKIVGCIMQGASVIGYIVAEGLVDAAYKPAVTQTEPQTEPQTEITRPIGFAAENCDTENGEKDNDPRD